MGKKTDIKLPATIAKTAARSLPATEKATLSAPSPKARKAATAPVSPEVSALKPAAKAPESKPAKKSAKTPKAAALSKKTKPAYTRDDIALRAYFIAEKRHAAGIHGSTDHDWIEAERQLTAEAAKVTKKKARSR